MGIDPAWLTRLEPGTAEEVSVSPPPSVNNLYLTTKTRRRVPTKNYLSWKRVAAPIVAKLRPPKAYPVEVWLTLAGTGWNKRRDCSNVEKAVVDLLVSQGILTDDSLPYVVGSHQVYRPDAGECRVVVRVVEPGEETE